MDRSLADLSAVDQWLAQSGQPAYRARQIRKWLFENRAGSITEMTDLPQALRQDLQNHFALMSTQIARHQKSHDGTEKLLVRLPDDHHVECVLLRDQQRRTICISSQVGCAMGCVFCASGLDGVQRNLTSSEIIEQMLHLQRLLEEQQRLSHIVMMGMGEPLANLDAVLPALDVATRGDGLGISPRRITISTVGIPASIDRLAQLDCKYNLAISLHAANDELRNQLVPVNKKIGIAALLDAADRYFEISGRRLTFEYVLLRGINDSPTDASQLVGLLKGRCLLFNVIPYNPVDGLPYRTPSAQAVSRFREVLIAGGITVKFRQRKGDEINAACGQLRRRIEVPR